MTQTIRSFKQAARELILDPEGTHHEFARGGHGRKLDFDLIKEGTPLYGRWIGLHAGHIGKRRLRLPGLVLVGTANGTNRIARDVAAELGVDYLTTQKISPSTVELDAQSVRKTAETFFRRAIIIEGVGTTGGTAMTAAVSTRTHSLNNEIPVEALFSWIRTPTLPVFDGTDVPYRAFIHSELPTYGPEICADMGYCALHWELIAHGGIEQTA